MAKATPTAAPSLQEQIAAKRVELIETRRSHAAGELVNPRAIGRIRKEIARLMTEHNRKEVSATSETVETKEEEKK